MSSGLKESDKLERPLFTPSTKAPQGQHDENIHPDARCVSSCVEVTVVKEMIGAEKARKVEELALQLYTKVSTINPIRIILILGCWLCRDKGDYRCGHEVRIR